MFPSEVNPKQTVSSAATNFSSKVTVNFTVNSQSYQTPNFEALKKQRDLELERRRKEAEEEKKKQFEVCYNEVKYKFTQQQERILDHTGQRWIKCEECGEIKPDYDFASYGGIDHVNLGICSCCSRKKV